MIQFNASKVSACVSEYGIIVIQFAGDGHYLTLQRSAEFDPNAHGDIHIECDGQGWGAYDVIESVVVGSSALQIHLSDDAEEDFGSRRDYRIECGVLESEWIDVMSWLNRLFEATELLSYSEKE